MSKKLFGYLLTGILALALVPSTAWGVCVVTAVSSVTPDPAPSTGIIQITPTAAAAGGANLNQEGVVERVTDLLINDDGAAPNCFAVNNTFRLTYNATLTNPTSIVSATTANFDVYDSAGAAGLVILANSTVGLAPGGTPQTVITVVVQQAGTAGNITTGATGSAVRIKNLRVDATTLTAGTNATATASVVSVNAGTLVTVTKNVGLSLKTADPAFTGVGGTGVCGVAAANGSQLGCANQSSGATVANAIIAVAEGPAFPEAFRTAGNTGGNAPCTSATLTCYSGVSQDVAGGAMSLILDAGTSIPSGVTVTWPATINNSAITNSATTSVIFTQRGGAQTTCTGPTPCSAIYDASTNPKTGVFNLKVGSGTASATGSGTANPAIGVAVATSSGSGTATLHAAFGPGQAAGTGADDVSASALPRYVTANTSASTTTRNLFSGNWFTIAPVSTTLMYTYVTTQAGFITGVEVANTGLDTGVPFATTGAPAGGAAANGGAQTGGVKFWFFGQDPNTNPPTPVVFAINTDSNSGGVGQSAGRGLDASGRIPPGGVGAFAVVGGTSTVGLLAAARTAGLTTATNFEGYIIAVASFTYAHGNGFVFQGANAFAYPANVMSNQSRSITAPSLAGENFNH